MHKYHDMYIKISVIMQIQGRNEAVDHVMRRREAKLEKFYLFKNVVKVTVIYEIVLF